MGGVSSRLSVGVLMNHIVLLNFVHYHSIRINTRTYYQILRFVLDLKISVNADLPEPSGAPDPEHSLPRGFSGQAVVKFVGEFHANCALTVLGVVVQVAGGLATQIRECLQVLVLVLAVRKHEQIATYLQMCQFRPRSRKLSICSVYYV